MTHETETAARTTLGRATEPLRIGQILKAAETREEPEKLITYLDGTHRFDAYAGEITLVVCRELKRAVETASAIALRLAMKFPERRVLLFNTYASADQLTSGFVRALHLLDLKVPNTFRKYLPSASDRDFDDTVDLPSPPNLLVMDCPTSTLTPETLAQHVHRSSADIVLLNSLEYAAFSDRRRKELAEGVLDLRYRKSVSFFVFTHGVRMMVPYVGGRGAVGVLSAFSRSIWHLLEEWERNAWTRQLYAEMDQLDGSE